MLAAEHRGQPLVAVRGGEEGGGILRAPFCFLDIHYFHCLRIVDLLKGTEASTKNIFGRYSSQRMKVSMAKDW